VGWLRYPVAALLAVVTTVAVFLFMQRLVALGEAALVERPIRGAIEFVRLKNESVTQKKERTLPTRPTQLDQPPAPKVELPSVTAPSGQTIAVAAPAPEIGEIDLAAQKLELGAPPSDAEAVPIVRIEPLYPRDAAQRGIEGWVVVVFDIDPTGAVVGARVLESEPRRVFDQAALSAVRKWKYKAGIADGQRYVTKGVRVRLAFRLER